ncbi:AMP-binding protein, partial [Micromonospora sp. NPDC023633]|uniref:AMP-binding protein n=1 Tax=Micromonospora sp. NPDC023633 TaxID=3154320 RepID=UPI0033EF6D9C
MTDRPERRAGYVHRALELFAGFGDREALVGDGRRLSYADVAAQVRGLAAALRGHGVRPGHAVLLALGNPVEGPLVQLALHLLGCRTMWIAPVTSRREVTEFVRLARPDAFVYDARDPAGLGPELAAGLPGVAVQFLGPGGAGPD